MGLFDSLRKHRNAQDGAQDHRHRLAKAWGLDEEDVSASEHAPAVPEPADAHDPKAYDRAQWQKKMKRILADLPDSRGEWEPMMAEARALGFDGPWMRQAQIEEFTLLARRFVADGVFTEREHRVLDLARDLIGLSDAEAEEMLRAIVTEAETFFGKTIQGA